MEDRPQRDRRSERLLAATRQRRDNDGRSLPAHLMRAARAEVVYPRAWVGNPLVALRVIAVGMRSLVEALPPYWAGNSCYRPVSHTLSHPPTTRNVWYLLSPPNSQAAQSPSYRSSTSYHNGPGLHHADPPIVEAYVLGA